MQLAHKNNILHRDLKPENIMIGDFGAVYVVDWGTALILVDAQQGNRVGTPMYMSPEQSRREAPAIVNEIYSLGAVLFHLLLFRFPMYNRDLYVFLQ